MLSASALFPFLAILASAAPSRRAAPCASIDAGFLEAFFGEGNTPLTLSSAGELTFGNGTAVQAQFQACSALPSQVDYNDVGRIVLEPSTSMCLTVTNPDGAPPYFAAGAPCSSDTTPSKAQTWGHGNDFGNVIFWAGSPSQFCGTMAGIVLDDTGANPVLGAHDAIEFGCSTEVGSSIESMTLTTTE